MSIENEIRPSFVAAEVQAPIIDTRSGVSPEELQLLEEALAAPAYGEDAAEEAIRRRLAEAKEAYEKDRYFAWLKEQQAKQRAEDKLKYPPREGDVVPLQAKLEEDRPWLKSKLGSYATNAF